LCQAKIKIKYTSGILPLLVVGKNKKSMMKLITSRNEGCGSVENGDFLLAGGLQKAIFSTGHAEAASAVSARLVTNQFFLSELTSDRIHRSDCESQ